eukprot:844620-Pleurochrysis_carterae.AAC.1
MRTQSHLHRPALSVRYDHVHWRPTHTRANEHTRTHTRARSRTLGHSRTHLQADAYAGFTHARTVVSRARGSQQRSASALTKSAFSFARKVVARKKRAARSRLLHLAAELRVAHDGALLQR